jgi:hypothetical protein
MKTLDRTFLAGLATGLGFGLVCWQAYLSDPPARIILSLSGYFLAFIGGICYRMIRKGRLTQTN